MPDTRDTQHMQSALSLAREALGTTAPNPCVACVIVKDGTIIAEGVTQKGGRPHAETIALEKIGHKAQGATAYVTLEPCCHTGETGPCTDALIKAHIARVVIATRDPSDKVAGKGIEALKKAGIEVMLGVCEAEAREINQGFFSVCEKKRPFVTLKLATSLDGKIATKTGQSQWITGEQARKYAHLLRAQHDAIMVGIGTALSDDPLLTCRLPGYEDRTPIRIVVDSHLDLPGVSKLAQTAARDTPVWILTCESESNVADNTHITALTCPVDGEGRVSLTDALTLLATKGITRLLVEGGRTLASALIKQRLVDELVWIRAPMLIGNDGLDAIGNLGVEMLDDSVKLSFKSSKNFGEDSVEVYRLLG